MPLIGGRNKFLTTNYKFFSSFNTSHSLSAPASTSWVTHVLFMATPLLHIGSTCGLFVATIVSLTNCTVVVIVLLELQYYIHKLFSWGCGMTHALFHIVLLEFQYYKQKLICWMYNPGGMQLQEEPF